MFNFGRQCLRALACLCCAASSAMCEWRGFVGAGPGLAILSGDARASVKSVSFYDAADSALVHVEAGWHAHDYFSLQGAYAWMRNPVTITSARIPADVTQTRFNVEQHHAAADFMVYFRDRKSWVRPFLSAGAGVSAFRGVNAAKPALRVAVGVDVLARNGWGFRYSFLETVTANPIGKVLDPPGQKKLMTFQNLFGIVKYF